jgi:hypothetical protein
MEKEKEKLLSCLNSDDKEVVELYINVLYQKGVKVSELKDILEGSKYQISSFKKNYIYIKVCWFWAEQTLKDILNKK